MDFQIKLSELCENVFLSMQLFELIVIMCGSESNAEKWALS